MMTTQRDHLFPTTSIGRTQSRLLSRTPSNESLTAHPLLSPTGDSAQRYVPYTPRQRLPTTTATTTNVLPSASSSNIQHQGDATSKLQLMNLKAAAQNIGLDTGTIGWAILEKLTSETENAEEWVDVWSAVTNGKATLLLPLEPATNERITADFVKDHIVLCDGSSRKEAPIVTLSGLRGVLNNTTLTFQSSLHPSSKLYQGILTPSTRSTTLANLPPLPQVTSAFPSFRVPSHTTSLPVPPRAKPPLPPRPSQQASRLTNPFASLFGHKSTPSTSSISSVEDTFPTFPAPIIIPAFTISEPVIFNDICKQTLLALKSCISESLAGSPRWLINRTRAFTDSLHPFYRVRKSEAGGEANPGVKYVIQPIDYDTAEVSDMFQDFYYGIEEELRLRARKEDEEKNELQDPSSEDDETKVLDRVEKAICELFYDRLLYPSQSDDLDHDEALSSRVAALNMLDLGLQHLDIIIDGDVANQQDLDGLIQACGGMLTQLDSVRSPADKAALLVEAHKIIVEGLTRLPPIRLRNENETLPAEVMLEPTQKARNLSKDQDHGSLRIESQAKDPAPNSQSVPTIAEPEQKANGVIVHSSAVNDEGNKPVSPSSSSPRPSTAASDKPNTSQDETPISLDVLFPLLIFSVVKSNPPHLVSHVLYTQRFRNKHANGEENYCVINLMAVIEFLENVDLKSLGLGQEGGRVLSAADLTPIPIVTSAPPPSSRASSQERGAAKDGLRGRVEQQVDAIAGSANKVLTGVVDTSFGMLKSLLPNNTNAPAMDNVQGSTPWNAVRPGFGLLRRESGFSIKSMLPGSTPKMGGEEELVTVSRPGSVRSRRSRAGSVRSGVFMSSDDESEEEEEEESEDDDEDEEEADYSPPGDMKSIKSFESMMSSKKKRRKTSRPSLSDRLASVSALTAKKSSPPRPSILPPTSHLVDSPVAESVVQGRLSLAPPNKRFLDCEVDDLKMSEVAELLKEYRRIVEDVRAIGGFKPE
ncbi:uncharacterized protein BT62DRAFT_1077021 [Guyanagaster necrorhizus]|uniref:VPS9 domain-containing protein n=1 Tax=Guyanagaster necrorhizus TaxID=856835 RepID=A0A9P7VR79_9AGAR|nr:uncharacterized protein BT62DRAFT_1077021 [Guyanagaster necrorhizus MCA 3950]KAG7445337.1 hypothetical protein BT62DRAFT_1077021 [Guyanagaster necrorhizus MCA 3950]